MVDIAAAAAVMAREFEQQKRVGLEIYLECSSCGRDCAVDSATSIEALIEHAMFDHVIRADVVIVRRETLIASYELALMLGLDARTEHEEKWREAQREAAE